MLNTGAITVLNTAYLIYSSKGTLSFTKAPKHIDAFVPDWHKFKNSISVQTGLLYFQQLTTHA